MKIILTSKEIESAIRKHLKDKGYDVSKISFKSKNIFDHTDGFYTYYRPQVSAEIDVDGNSVEEYKGMKKCQ